MLLIGVSAYPRLEQRLHLSGPRHDVELLKKTFLDLGLAESNITVLADGSPAAVGLPTRTAILDGLDDLTERAQPGDRVVFYFSGHGARQPPGPDHGDYPSTDGFEAILLPHDAGRWSKSRHTVENAISNRVLKSKVDAIRAKGAFVWVIIDSCHSQNMVRGFSPATRLRGVSFDELGIPQGRVDAVFQRSARQGRREQEAKLDLASTQQSQGDYAGFFAAQATEQTLEFPQPIGAPNPTPHGLFTFTLAKALIMNGAASLERIGDQILKIYAEHGRTRPTPSFVGSGLKESISGAPASEHGQQFRITLDHEGKLTIPAGELHNIGQGSRFAVLPSALATTSDAIGYAAAQTTNVSHSILQPIEHEGVPAPPAHALNHAIARLIEPVVPLTIRVALPTLPRKPSARQRAALAAIEQTATDGPSTRVIWQAPGTSDVDARVLLDGSFLSIVPGAFPSGPPSRSTRSIPLRNKDLTRAIERRLEELSRALNLVRIANQLRVDELRGFEVHARLLTPGASQDLRPARIPNVKHGDQLQLSFTNTGPRPIDITVLYLDSDYVLSGLASVRAREGSRLPSETGRKTVTVTAQNTSSERPSTFGVEHVIVIAATGMPEQPASDFLFLASEPVAPTRGMRNTFDSLLASTGFTPDRERGARRVPVHEITDVWMRVLSWNVSPP